jgi:hypothetical protein
MAIPALSPQSFTNLRKQMSQYQATTGRAPSSEVIQGYLEGDIAGQAGKIAQQGALEQQEKSRDLQAGQFDRSLASREKEFERTAEIGQEQFGRTQDFAEERFGKELEFQRGESKESRRRFEKQTAIQENQFTRSLKADYDLTEYQVKAKQAAERQQAKSKGIGSIFGALGTVAGIVAAPYTSGASLALSGAAAKSGGGTVICEELCRQGLLAERVVFLDALYRLQYIDDDTYRGYMFVAPRVVKLMQKHNWVTRLVRPFGVAWAYEMASRVKPSEFKGNLLGKLMLKLCVPVSRLLGRLV